MFDPVDPKQSFPALEKGILKYWKEEAVFHRSLDRRRSAEVFGFYDGPPFATGLPHYGHILAGTIKDVIPRYQTMRGHYVERRFGWDCHGLPIENLIEKEHGLKTKRDIEAMGAAAFNELCRKAVLRYTNEWRTVVERMGRFVDMDFDYRTMDPDYMESIWWVFRELWDKKLIEEGFKPMHVCPRCATPLSNFEVTQGYKDVTDASVTAKFLLKEDEEAKGAKGTKEKTYILAWTTTPWTLPGNLFLAVHPTVKYVKVKANDETYIVAENLVAKVFDKIEHAIDGKPFAGKTLVGKKYEPLFPYYAEDFAKQAFEIVGEDFVTTEDGTGIVHIATGFGEDDFKVGKDRGMPPHQHVTMEGVFTKEVKDFAGMHVKPKDNPTATDRLIINWLKEHKKFFSETSYKHSYPHCWRCDSPLLNYVTSSWFVTVEKIKNDMLAANKKTEWVPAHLRDGRFGKWLEGARDWAISRNRYWGTPLPIWRCTETGDVDVIGSRKDLCDKFTARFTTVTAVRHGESEANVKPRYQGVPPGTPLTKRGRAQAEATGKLLAKDDRIRVIYASPLLRAQQTAAIIAEATGATVVTDERLRETAFGDYEGKAIDFSDLNVLTAKRAKKFESNAPESIYHFPGMETWESVNKRVSDFYEEILPRHRSEHIVVVTHADPLQNMKQFFTKEDPVKLSHQPYPRFAEPFTFYWDHETNAELDLHKHIVDTVAWPGSPSPLSVRVSAMRHGETDYNADGRIQPWDAGPTLSAKGREQIEKAAKALAKEKFDAVLCSDFARTKETLEIVRKHCDLPKPVFTELLRERNFGAWGGKKVKDMLKKHPFAWHDEHIALHDVPTPEGESLNDFLKRVGQLRDMLLKEHAGKRVLLVTHGGVLKALAVLAENKTIGEASSDAPPNGDVRTFELRPLLKRIPEVLDCWFESGSMPYAQCHYPFRASIAEPDVASDDPLDRASSRSVSKKGLPPGFPADFIAEGIDQTRGWFYTLTVLSAALFKSPAFRHCVVNGTVLAEDGRKMSKKLKNYPDPMEVVERHGADAVRFTLMRSPAVRAEDLRFSEKLVEETVRAVVLPLWNAYGFFVTYANAANFEAAPSRKHSTHPMDRYIRAEVRDLAQRMTREFEAYDLSGMCDELTQTIDRLTNWYIRLSRRRFAGKTEGEGGNDEDRADALATLHEALVTMSQLIAPVCPYLADAIYMNLVGEDHGSVHLTDWPEEKKLSKEETALLARHRVLQTIASLGMKLRSEKKIKVRQPLKKATVALPPALKKTIAMSDEDRDTLQQELNVKLLEFTDDPGSLGQAIAMVDARKVGPRLGKKVQEVIAAGKRGEFEQSSRGILILDEELTADEFSIVYKGSEGADVAGAAGVIVSLDTTIDDELKAEGSARDLVRHIQKLRKDAGLSVNDRITLQIDGCSDLLKTFGDHIARETNATFGKAKGEGQTVSLDDEEVTIIFEKQ